MKTVSSTCGEKQVSLMVSQSEVFSVFSLLVRNLSMQGNGPAHL